MTDDIFDASIAELHVTLAEAPHKGGASCPGCEGWFDRHTMIGHAGTCTELHKMVEEML